ncbi:hypothetical protein [Aeoliella mucimassa]|uniref:Uncharacterized protein n=1 Tax=Aeoliella mucimassa TaxID=2527972 RepID=A0A518ATP8_9BACT|nr:hypothetical protein [Aeoliella mucimassa]QDU58092.1 hypothetical protein Pan181_43180 [Aeoliella mucimassa]
MYKFVLPAAAFVALAFTGITADSADAKGFHFSTGRVHVDVGNPHARHTYYGGYGGGFASPGYSQGCYYPNPGWNHGGGWGGAHSWHDNSHWDYHAPSLQWHGNHFDYMPGHYDYHQQGHWDHHHP